MRLQEIIKGIDEYYSKNGCPAYLVQIPTMVYLELCQELGAKVTNVNGVATHEAKSLKSDRFVVSGSLGTIAFPLTITTPLFHQLNQGPHDNVNIQPVLKKVCECGAEKTGQPQHSTWCQIYAD